MARPAAPEVASACETAVAPLLPLAPDDPDPDPLPPPTVRIVEAAAVEEAEEELDGVAVASLTVPDSAINNPFETDGAARQLDEDGAG